MKNLRWKVEELTELLIQYPVKAKKELLKKESG